MFTDPIILPDTPAVEGLCFRSILGEEDAEALYAVHTGRSARDGIDPLSAFEDIPSRDNLHGALAQAVEAQQEDQWLVAQVNQQVVGYSQIGSWSEDDGRRVYLILGWVLPEWRGRGIGTAMLHWGEQTARQMAAQHPDVPFEFAANASSTEQDATALLLNEGYYAGYTVLEMGWDISTPLPAHALPTGIEVRPALPEHYPLITASIAEAYQNEYADNRFLETFDPEAYIATLKETRHDPTLWQVAWEGQQIAGQVLSLIENGRAEVFEVSVRPAWRRKGLARALLTRALEELRERHPEVIRLRTVADFRTRASDLYRSVGFRVLKEYPRYRKSPD
jgi:mycothiol synthase